MAMDEATAIADGDLKVGAHIRKLRRMQGTTLQQLADTCGFSRSLLSKIETGKVVPPVATLVKIAKGLGTSIAAIVEEGKNVDAQVTTWEEVVGAFTQTVGQYKLSTIAAEMKNKKFQPFFFMVEKGEVKRHSVSHEGEEYILVMEGTIQFRVGDTQYTLHEGDSLYFNAQKEHTVIPVTERAIFLDIFA